MNTSSNVFITIFILCLIVQSLFVVYIGFANRTITVPIDYSDIATALIHASPGDVIVVQDGVYNGFVVNKSVTIIGNSNKTVIVKGPISIYANNVKLSSMKIILEKYSKDNQSAVISYANNTMLIGVVIESAGYGVITRPVDLDKGRTSLYIEYTKITAGLEYESSQGVSAIRCDSLSIIYSNITLVKGTNSVESCSQTQIIRSSIQTPGTGLNVGMFSKNIEVTESTIIAGGTAIYVSGGEGIYMNNNISSNGTGIVLSQTGGKVIKDNKINAGDIGLQIVGDNNLVHNNTISAGRRAIELRGSGNMISNNTLSGGRGIDAGSSYGNTIIFNYIDRTGLIGVYMSKYTGDNVIYGNTFWYCYNYNAVDESGKNQWFIENSTIKMGNFWYDHTEPDIDKDGIVDTPYYVETTLNTPIVDKYPLAKPVFLGWQYPETTTQYWTTTTTLVPSLTTTISQTVGTESSSQITTSYAMIKEQGSSQLIIIGAVLIVLLLLMFIAVKRIKH